MIPIIYAKTEISFVHNGIGFLTDAVKCEVTEERNGKYEATVIYPITGQLYSDITEGVILKIKPNETSDLQLFRVYKISKPINGIVTVNAEHISYQLGGIPIMELSASGTPHMVMTEAFGNAVFPCGFTPWSDITETNSVNIKTPRSLRATLGGQECSLLEVFGGEYEFDNYTVKLHRNRGNATDVLIAYGKNLTDVRQESNIAGCYTHLLPFAIIAEQNTDEYGSITETEEKTVTLPEKCIELLNPSIDFVKVLTLDLTDQFGEGEEITADSLRSRATAYIETNNLTSPKINITVSFMQLWQTVEYANIAPLERVRLCDTVTVRFTELGVDAKAKVIKTVYDNLKEQYISIELGDAKSNFTGTVISQQNHIGRINEVIRTGKATATAQLKNAILEATNLITGQSGGYVVLNPSTNPQEILIMDTPSIQTAVNIWRWNSGGLGHSTSGYNGSFPVAITADGKIVADFITAGELNGNIIKAGSILANAISQEYKTEVTDEISSTTLELEQLFNAANGQLQSLITQLSQSLTAEATVRAEAVSSLMQTLEALSLSFTNGYTGGINLIRNSAGQGGMSNDWEYSGTVRALQDSGTKNNTVSNSCFELNPQSLLRQRMVNIVSGRSYTLTFLCKKTVAGYTASVKLIHDGNETVVMSSSDAFGWQEFSVTVDNVGNNLTLEAVNGTGTSIFFLSDIMLVEGTTKARWTPAPNEIYTTNVRIDRSGINITNTESDTETIIDNTQFAVKHRGETVITVNKDETMLKKSIVDADLTVGKVKFLPKENRSDGLDIILLD